MADHLKKKKIGLFGGSFNPIHHGHLNFACELREKGGLDEIWFIPASTSPFKQEKKVSGDMRCHMVALALGNDPYFRLYNGEVMRGGISYTITTIETVMAEKKEEEEFYLCLTEETLSRFTEWKDYKKILSMVPLLVGVQKEKPKMEAPVPFISCPVTLFEISATQIRRRLKQRIYCNHLVPQKVLDFIYENQLYFNE